jgi:signal transduction histidine kinase
MVLAMVDNLLSNAVTYTPPCGNIRLTIATDSGGTVLSINNSCNDISRQDLTHVLEPFWRKDPSRSSHDHCGLGLTLVAAYAKALRLELKLDLPEPHRFVVSVHFPPASTPQPATSNARNLPLRTSNCSDTVLPSKPAT